MKKPSFLASIIVVLFVITLLGISILHYGVAPQIPIVVAAIFVACYGLTLGYKWKELESAMAKGIFYGIPSILILCLIGMLIGVWVLNGTVPTITYYGLHTLSPDLFLMSTVLICSIVSVVCGSSWSSIGTIGVSLMGVAYGLDISPAMTAGAIVSGAIFGDKISPLSDTTNLASATAKVNIYEHIKHMLWTTIPSFIITLAAFTAIGFFLDRGNEDNNQIETIINVLSDEFMITPITLMSPLLIIILAVKRMNPIPSLVIGLIVAILTTFYTVPNVAIGTIMETAHNGFVAETGVEAIDQLLSLGGLSSMLFGVSLIIISLAFGGIIQQIGIAHSIIEGIQKMLKSRGNVITSTVCSCLGINLTVGEQYLSIILPGQLFESAFKKVRLHPKNLSRTLEDAGTIIHPMIPWGVTGAFIMSTLNIGMEYVPYVFISMITPVVAIIYGYTGIGLAPLQEEGKQEIETTESRSEVTRKTMEG
ncbi:NhaC family Na+:H+ antiporter [Bacillus pakistanensis]|uniref:NhaC family Na+:H+ antiporter n=1 Tax=Rossellomorea pakistanensis TaxID=992288 RepID=A0ABS2NE04_9BACI|nr:Na+/H+ antiporter NhaC [Bacillus pakistanensis]MBM7586085.1 NhaC family Na+:H+ antiporter [Bacillus pakistanensis]